MQKAVQRQRMGILLCEQNFRDVWRRNKSVRAEIGQILRTHTRGSISSRDILVIVRVRQIQNCFITTAKGTGLALKSPKITNTESKSSSSLQSN